MTQYDIESLWVKKSLDVAFSFGDIVRIKSGQNAGNEGHIVALFKLKPHPTYMIEILDGRSVVAGEPDLELIEGNTGATLTLIKEQQ